MNLLKPVGRHLQSLLLGLANLALVACGPGVGGTGSGNDAGVATPSAPDVPGLQARALCGSGFDALLVCGPAAGTVGGTGVVFWADRFDAATAAARLEADVLQLQAPCAALAFSGRWGSVNGGAAAFWGAATVSGLAQTAALRAVPVAGSSPATVQVWLENSAGTTLLGPLTLRAQTSPATLANCPG